MCSIVADRPDRTSPLIVTCALDARQGVHARCVESGQETLVLSGAGPTLTIRRDWFAGDGNLDLALDEGALVSNSVLAWEQALEGVQITISARAQEQLGLPARTHIATPNEHLQELTLAALTSLFRP